MPRIRSVYPSICESATLAGVSSRAERTFVRLWTYCDDEGRARADPKLLKAALYPLHDDMTVVEVTEDLAELENAGAIVLYSDPRYGPVLACPSWHTYQHPQKRSASKYEPPPKRRKTGTRTVRERSNPQEACGNTVPIPLPYHSDTTTTRSRRGGEVGGDKPPNPHRADGGTKSPRGLRANGTSPRQIAESQAEAEATARAVAAAKATARRCGCNYDTEEAMRQFLTGTPPNTARPEAVEAGLATWRAMFEAVS